MKLFIWEWQEGYSWEQATSFAPDEKTARELAKKEGFQDKDTLEGPPTAVYEVPYCVYNIY